jgi:hypothetical protein
MSGLVAVAVASAVARLPAARPRGGPHCTAVAQLVAMERLRQFRVRPSAGPWRSPDVSHGNAHAYRTVLKREGALPPDFAGHIRVVRIGCGAGSVCPAFADRSNGRVTFDPRLAVVSWMTEEPGVRQPANSERLNYRRDSSLLVVLGVRNEEERTSGATLYRWTAGALHLVRFVPRNGLCSNGTTR